MKITVLSDLHAEFDTLPRPIPGSDVLVLSGDIYVIDYLLRGSESPYQLTLNADFSSFMDYCSENWKNVIYILGNHEYYHGRIDSYAAYLKVLFNAYPNVHVLDNDSIVIDEIKFIGSTLWFDGNKRNPTSLVIIGDCMNDFRLITWGKPNYRKFKVSDAVLLHDKAVAYLKKEIEGYVGKVVVCTHHAPSPLSINAKYAGDYHLNGAYHSDLSELILDNEHIVLWTHGHTHSSFDYHIGKTRIVANPKGYREENKNEFNPNLTLDI